MGGANLLGQYLDAGVIDEVTVTIAPVLPPFPELRPWQKGQVLAAVWPHIQ